jgi:two-component system, cell cycle sensor histidine kinase and response regulator CckA
MSIGGQKRAPQEQQTKLGQLELLLELAGTVSRAREPHEIYRAAVQGLVHALAADRAAVLIFDPDSVLRFKDWVGLSDEYRAKVEGYIPWPRGADDALPIAISDVMQDASLSAYRQVFAKAGVRAIAFIPLIAGGGLLGDLELHYNEPHEFQADEIHFAQTIATQVALAIEQRHVEKALRDSEERFRAAFFQAAVGIAQTSIQGDWLLLNDRLCEILGYTQAELRGKTFLDITHPDDREANVGARRRLMAGEISSWSMEKRYIRKNGATVWARTHVSLVRDQHRLPQYFISVIEDITDRILAERALWDSEQRLRLALSAGVGVWDCDLRSNAPVLSPLYGGIFGHPPSTHAEWFGLVHPDDRKRVIALVRQSIDQVNEWEAEFRLLCPDGSVRWLLSKGTVFLGDDGRPARMLGVSLDITQRKQTEEALRVSQQRLELAQGTGGIGTWDWDVTTDETHCSSGYGPLYGLQPGDLAPGREQWLELIHLEDRGRISEELNRVLDHADFFSAEFRVVWPDGTIHWLFGKGQVFRDSLSNPIRMIGVNMDISERKRAEAALRESEERFRIMADTAPVMICAAGPDKLATFFNAGWLIFTGRSMEQELGYGWTEGVYPDDVDACLATYSASFEARRDCHIEYRLRRADGEYRSVVCNGVPRFAPDGVFAGYIASCIDITDAKRAQEEALARQKLESVGVLANGIAHDFNNLLGGILASSELALEGRGSSTEEELLRIRTAAIHGGEIVRQLMIYSGKENPAFEPVDLSLVIKEMLQLLEVSISKHALLRIELGENMPAVQANPAQIRQVVMNLVTNASEAIGERAGVIRIGTALVRVGPDSPGTDVTKLPEGDYLRMEVSDTGIGIAPAVQARIFDPFFTTKFPGRGRGLGLAVTDGIVRNHGGAIHVRASSQGTAFQVWLPCVAKEARGTGDSVASAAVDKAASRAGRILVVEDEDLLRLAVSKALAKRGFSVLEACDGSTGMELIRAHADNIDVVLLDVTLPGLSSREVFAETGRIRPELNVILTSAYGKETVAASFAGLRVERFIRKPFQLAELLAVVQGALTD